MLKYLDAQQVDAYSRSMDNTNIKDIAADMADMHDQDEASVSLQFVRIDDTATLTRELERFDLIHRPCGNVMPAGWVLVGRDDKAINEHLANPQLRATDDEWANADFVDESAP